MCICAQESTCTCSVTRATVIMPNFLAHARSLADTAPNGSKYILASHVPILVYLFHAWKAGQSKQASNPAAWMVVQSAHPAIRTVRWVAGGFVRILKVGCRGRGHVLFFRINLSENQSHGHLHGDGVASEAENERREMNCWHAS